MALRAGGYVAECKKREPVAHCGEASSATLIADVWLWDAIQIRPLLCTMRKCDLYGLGNRLHAMWGYARRVNATEDVQGKLA
mmetsp:Transcript_72961/g.121796  ORF Transcript_72961/g.121796 Transcript_72961/m.121796 type:complete len:82 (+) Transcript_72961:60-305(+)